MRQVGMDVGDFDNQSRLHAAACAAADGPTDNNPADTERISGAIHRRAQ
jgi:hypothetical protein